MARWVAKEKAVCKDSNHALHGVMRRAVSIGGFKN